MNEWWSYFKEIPTSVKVRYVIALPIGIVLFLICRAGELAETLSGVSWVMIKRALFRIQPIEQIKKRKQRRRDMWERHQQFAEYVERVRKKRRNNDGLVADNMGK